MTAATIPFWKVESVGNDFVLVHLKDAMPHAGGNIDAFLTELAIKSCARHFGVGSDGLLVLSKTGDQSLQLRMFNPDGTEDFCGNGLRCAFAHALRRGWIEPGAATIRHLGQTVPGRAEPDGLGDFFVTFTLQPASYEPAKIPLAREEAFDTDLYEVEGKTYRGSVLTTGTVHTIIPVTDLPEDEEFLKVSPQMEHHPIYPERTSIMWVQQVGARDLKLRIWERGAGETFGCGTGSTAAAIDFLRRNPSGDGIQTVQVHNPGGTLTVSAPYWYESSEVSGTAREVFRGDLVLGPDGKA